MTDYYQCEVCGEEQDRPIEPEYVCHTCKTQRTLEANNARRTSEYVTRLHRMTRDVRDLLVEAGLGDSPAARRIYQEIPALRRAS